MDPNFKLQPASIKNVKDRKYQSFVGRLIYCVPTWLINIAFSVCVVGQFMHSPNLEHFEVVYRILRYLKGTPKKGLSSQHEDPFQLRAAWMQFESVTDTRSTFRYCTYVGGNLMTWRSKQQNVVARSSVEVEFRAIAQGICEVIWFRKTMEELRTTKTLPIKLYSDSKATISIAQSSSSWPNQACRSGQAFHERKNRRNNQHYLLLLYSKWLIY